MTKIIKQNEIISTYEDFQNKIIKRLEEMWGKKDWLDENNAYMSFNTIFILLDNKYGERGIKYDNEETWIKQLLIRFSDLLPDIFAKQQVFINEQLKEYLSKAENRAVILKGTNISSRDSVNKSKTGSSAAPLDVVISNAEELSQLAITSANLSNMQLIDNFNGANSQENINFVSDIRKALNTDYSLRIEEFLNSLRYLYRNMIITSKSCCSPMSRYACKFKNGINVWEVDYKGDSNEEAIQANFEFLNNRIDNIPAGTPYVGVHGIDVNNDNHEITLEPEVLAELEKIKDKTDNTDFEAYKKKTDSEIANNQSEIEELRNRPKARIYFYNGESKLFKTKLHAQAFINRYSLTQGVDYEITISHMPLGIGDNGRTITNKLRRSDLPDTKFKWKNELRLGFNFGNYGSMLKGYNWENTEITNEDIPIRYVGKITEEQASGLKMGRETITLKLNGGVDQTANVSSYIERYEIIFLKDIIIEEKGGL